jgi:transposase
MKIGLDEPGRPRRLDRLSIIDRSSRKIAKLVHVGQDRVRSVWAAQEDNTRILHQMGRPTKVIPQTKQAVIELTLQHPNFADLQIAQVISERFAVPIARATIN